MNTIPTNTQSVLRLLAPTGSKSCIVLSWQSVPTRNYLLQRATDLTSPPSFLTFANNLAGQLGVTIFTDTNTVGGRRFFYRVAIDE